MSDLRGWRLTPQSPMYPLIAADARISPTHYPDDQSWELALGNPDESALIVQTRYGGRAGLVTLVPMWTIEDRPIYQFQAYSTPPFLAAFAPGYLRTHAKIVPTLALRAEYHAADSRTLEGRFLLRNTGDKAITITLDMVGFAAIEGSEIKGRTLSTASGSALQLGDINGLHPAVVMDGAVARSPVVNGKLTAQVTIAPNSIAAIRWAHAGMTDTKESIQVAQSALKRKWTDVVTAVEMAAHAIPMIETGDADTDALIAFSYHALIGAFLKPTASLPFASFAASRNPGRGFGGRGGSDHVRTWSGQEPTLAYLTALAIAPVDPGLAQGVVRNYLAIQRDDGWIDAQPGLAGQRANALCTPLLARLAWGIFQYTEDDAFLREAYPALRRFFNRWFAPDCDADGDGIPEWSDDLQRGYPFYPITAFGAPWGQNADLRLIESPDLIAFLLSEAVSLYEMGYYLREPADLDLKARITHLQSALETFWDTNEGRYTYRDRDTDQRAKTVKLLEDGRGDEEQFIAQPLTPPNRVIIRIIGGVDHAPDVSMTIEGTGKGGLPIRETAAVKDFFWYRGQGVYTTRAIFANVDRIVCTGLSRVYRIHARTLDTGSEDVSLYLPLWALQIPTEHGDALVERLMKDGRFWRTNGVTMLPTNEPAFPAANTSIGGGVWAFFNTLIGEAFIEGGKMREAAELLKRIMRAQTAALKSSKTFSEYIHADEPRGLGESGHLGGIIPLHLMLRVFGVRIISPTQVWTGGLFAWDAPVTFRQHGVVITRSTEGTIIRFPSGNEIRLSSDAPLQNVRDRKIE